jgi:hypothetical protein
LAQISKEKVESLPEFQMKEVIARLSKAYMVQAQKSLDADQLRVTEQNSFVVAYEKEEIESIAKGKVFV